MTGARLISTASPAMKSAISRLGAIRTWSWRLRPQARRWWLTSRHRGTSHKGEVNEGLDHTLLPIHGLIIHGWVSNRDESPDIHSCPAWVPNCHPSSTNQSFEWQALKNFGLNLNHNCGFRLLIRYQKPIDNTVYLSTNLYNIYSTIFQRSSLSLASLKKKCDV